MNCTRRQRSCRAYAVRMSTLPLLPGNPVYGEGFAASTVSAGPALAWSGSMSEDLSAPDPRNWMRPGRTRLDELCAGAKDALQQAGAENPSGAPRTAHSLGRPECDRVAPRPHGGGVWFGGGPGLAAGPRPCTHRGTAGRPDVPHP